MYLRHYKDGSLDIIRPNLQNTPLVQESRSQRDNELRREGMGRACPKTGREKSFQLYYTSGIAKTRGKNTVKLREINK